MGGWAPWRELRARQHISLSFSPLPPLTGGAIYCRRDDRAAIVLDPRLSRRERKAALAHELIHDELGSSCRCEGMPATWDAVIVREEQAIDREVARRLVPRHELAALLHRGGEIGLELHEVADHFDVPDEVARLAVSMFAGEEGLGEQVA